ncbi:DNA mismatch repair protein [Megasphaera cerevisiae DSM 20462]|uniref:DNA mismatch repair protein MutL n=1 Tax=Megasphaera cerevisiae DSM 20462 TaxID=1122219 RepID=A0A0J6ZNS3_9FIRM|nr:DNA mismatch repair endonuclease MutL [Megasphaera cerevisiae]KMO86521.1 DNA mismatch repair protein [Megasphaera cerevisiae DSM 20462]MCI1749823.1 DNA mismatch repair endonuclease MutL [Megasphaera cerevisiae]OKY54756.1 DNA mismatch repair protein MutL [Megasphaera cerevisiae]SJZ92026.1 DNA mismatch repair protein MutL [Megasphaera cerevisiae DSM 20462]
MSSIINVLDEKTRNKIAAGEVVERPASCIKELVENAIDASASAIEIEIADGGQSYMRITDNGSGMSAEDAHKCIIRHATSKISTVEDIFAISSLGFRGEAVPSIAAVSHMQITTRRPEDDFATHLILEGGTISSEDQAGAPVGTTMEVSDLFYNTPARRKFMKSERTESSKISEMITKLALAQPAIQFTFTNNGRTSLHTGGSGDLKDTIANIYGADLAREIFSITYDSEGLRIEGYVGKPSVLKSSRAWQTCIVNHRIVHNPVMFKAVENAYHAMLPKAGYPFVMLHLHTDPGAIDVNVHPSKTEIKFADEQVIYRAIYHSIISALVAQETPENIATTMDLQPRQVRHIEAAETELELRGQSERPQAEAQVLSFEAGPAPHSVPDAPAETGFYSQQSADRIKNDSLGESSSRPYSAAQTDLHTPLAVPTASQTAQFHQALAQNEEEAAVQKDHPGITFEGDEDVFIPLGEVADCFIIAKKGQDLYIIDQHAAHERVRYDRFCQRVERMPGQQLLTAEFIEMDAEDMTLLAERKDVFADLGYTYSEAGPTTLRIEEVPCDLQTSDIAGSIRDICQALHENGTPDKAVLRHRSLAYLSCHGAIKAGDTLNIRQMKQLLEELFHTEKPYVCPHGRPIIVRFTPDELAKLFKRT